MQDLKRNKQQKAIRRATRRFIESLETRRLMASVVINGDQPSANFADSFVINRSGSLGRIFVNGSASPAATWDLSVANSVQVNGLGGNDALTIDYGSGDPFVNATIGFDGGASTDTLTVTGSANADTIAMATGQVQFNGKAIGYSNSESIILNLGSGIDTLNAAGDTSVSAALLRVNVLASGTVRVASGANLPTFSDVDVASTGTFDLNGASPSIDAISGAGQILNNGANATLTIGRGNGSSVFPGSINDGSGSIGLTKEGTGRIELAGSSNYSGATWINAGALRISHASALGSTSTDTQIAGGTNTGVLELAGGISTSESITLYAKNSDSGTSLILPSLLNVSGTNTIGSTVYGQFGGTGYTLRSDAGMLRLANGFSRIDGSTYHRPFQLRGAGSAEISGSVNTSTSWGLSYWKMDAGTWTIRNNTTPGSMKVDAGSLVVNRISNAALVVNTGKLQTLETSLANDASGSSVIPSLSGSGTVDIGNNALVVDYGSSVSSPRATIETLVRNGFNNGSWNGTGITSSAAAGSTINTAIGVAEGTDLYSSFPASFAGQSVDSTSVIAAYTLSGDANLDGVVSSTDFNTLVSNFGGSGKRWFTGDFNYDTKVNTIDFNDLAGNFGRSLTFAESPWVAVPAANFSQISSSQFTDDELRYVKPLFWFSQVANAVVETGPTRGFIDISVWREPVDNEPYNARVLENHVAFAFFYSTNRPWNPYYGNQQVRNRLEATMDYWTTLQGSNGLWPEYSASGYNVAATSFGLRTMVRTLELLQTAPPIDPGVMQRTVDACVAGIRAMIQDSTNLNAVNDYTNQYPAIYGTTLQFIQMYPEYANEFLDDLRARIPEAGTKHISPAGFKYEAGGSDWGYTLGTDVSQLTAGWHLLRGGEFQADIVDDMTKYHQFVNYNFLKQPDNTGYLTNFGPTSRTGFASAVIGYNDNPISEYVPEARFLQQTAAEEASALTSLRNSLVSQWGNFGSLAVPNSSSYTPGPFIDLDRVNWRPTAAQRTASENALPYLASTTFNHQDADSRRPIQFTYARRPSYYTIFNSGNTVSSRQRLGLGAIWNPVLGTVMQSQANSDTNAWGTRASGAARVYEASSLTASFTVNGSSSAITAGSRNLANGNVVATYALGGAGSKSITCDDTGISVAVTHTGNFTEEIPLLRRSGETISVSGNTVTFSRSGTTMTITFSAGVTASVTSSGSVGGLQIAKLVLNASSSLTYRVAFS